MIQLSPEKKRLLLNSFIIFLFWLLRLTFFAPGACISFSDYLGTFIPALLLSIIVLGLAELLADIDCKKTILGVVAVGFLLFTFFALVALMPTARFFLILALIFAFITFHEKKALSKATKLGRWTIRLMGFLFPALWIAGWECAIYNQSYAWSMRLCLLVGEAFVILTWKISHREIRRI
ncbi:hypothetical protein VFC49_10370 [Thermococcus sp. SY098]|uniref:hypothetical protein n=1 Tax=Thermococcus sp. SY098 TaxID=3111325 RepID=UPI002D7A136A|nr:hypothetical protein [Thermococcus sp. SY098]WRS52421.1 hypothetical protein VFC49_10370 [Thermococcus sp. SY098]